MGSLVEGRDNDQESQLNCDLPEAKEFAEGEWSGFWYLRAPGCEGVWNGAPYVQETGIVWVTVSNPEGHLAVVTTGAVDETEMRELALDLLASLEPRG